MGGEAVARFGVKFLVLREFFKEKILIGIYPVKGKINFEKKRKKSEKFAIWLEIVMVFDEKTPSDWFKVVLPRKF